MNTLFGSFKDAQSLDRSHGSGELNVGCASTLLQPLLLDHGTQSNLPAGEARGAAESPVIDVAPFENGELRELDSDPVAATLALSANRQPNGFLFVFYFCHGVQEELPSMALYLVLKSAYDVSPANYSFVSALSWLPWALKPAVGYWSDHCRIGGRRRTPHIFIGIALNLLGCILLSFYPFIQSKFTYLAIFIFNELAAVVAETAVDSLMAEMPRTWTSDEQQHGSLQSTVWTWDAAGTVVGSVIPIVAFAIGLSPRAILIMSAAVVALQALALPFLPQPAASEPRTEPSLSNAGAWRRDGKLDSVLLKALVFVFLVSSTPTSGDAFTYFQTDVLKFGATFLSGTTVLQALSNWVAATVFTTRMQSWDLRRVFLMSIVLTALVNLLNLVVVTRWNAVLGIPDKVFVVAVTVVQGAAAEMVFLPVAVMAARLAPAGREGTTYATVMAVVNMSWACSELSSGLLSRTMRISEGQYASMPLLLVAMAMVALFPLLFLHFVPDISTSDADRSEEQAPAEGVVNDASTFEYHDSAEASKYQYASSLDDDVDHRKTLLTSTR